MDSNTFAKSLFLFGAELARSQAEQLTRKRPAQTRLARVPSDFDRLGRVEQLEAIDLATHAKPDYADAVAESFSESDDVAQFLQKLFDATSTSDAELGAFTRAMVIKYVSQCADVKNDDLTEFL